MSVELLSRDELLERADRQVREEVRWVLTKGVRSVPVARLTVPGTDMLGQKEVPRNLEREIGDFITSPAPWAALMNAIQHSDCPYVEQIRGALAQAYCDSHADEVSYIRAGIDL